MPEIQFEKFIQTLNKKTITFAQNLALYHRSLEQLAQVGPKLSSSLNDLLQFETSNIARIASLALKSQLAINDAHVNSQRQILPAYASLTSNKSTLQALQNSIKSYKQSLKQSENSKTGPQKTDNDATLQACSKELISRAGAFEKQRFDSWKQIVREIGQIELKRGIQGCQNAPRMEHVERLCCEYGDLVGKLSDVVGDVQSLIAENMQVSRNYEVDRSAGVKSTVIRETGWE